MDRMVANLPVIDSCDACGACCRVVPLPPFVRRLDGTAEEAWDRLEWDRPDLLAELLEAERSLKSSGSPMFGSPCLWYDAATARCLHHALRPRACRDFAIGSVDCRDARRRAGIS
jgi:Fe-S-cluster containining protein